MCDLVCRGFPVPIWGFGCLAHQTHHFSKRANLFRKSGTCGTAVRGCRRARAEARSVLHVRKWNGQGLFRFLFQKVEQKWNKSKTRSPRVHRGLRRTGRFPVPLSFSKVERPKSPIHRGGEEVVPYVPLFCKPI